MDTKSLSLLSILTSILIAAPLGAEISDVETRSFNVGSAPQLEIEVGHADVSIRPGPTDTIDFTITRKAKTNDEAKAAESFQASPSGFEQDGDTVRLKIESQKASGWFSKKPVALSIDVLITVPAKTEVRITSGSGDINLREVDGNHRIECASGDIEFRTIRGDLDFSTASGDIEGTSVAGTLTFAAASGDIELEDVNGVISAVTASGDIEIKGSDLSIKASVASGDVELRIVDLAGDIVVDSASGDVSVAVGPNNHAQVSLSTASGNVSSKLALNDLTQDKKRHQLKGTLGDGTHRIDLEAASGNVELKATR